MWPLFVVNFTSLPFQIINVTLYSFVPSDGNKAQTWSNLGFESKLKCFTLKVKDHGMVFSLEQLIHESSTSTNLAQKESSSASFMRLQQAAYKQQLRPTEACRRFKFDHCTTTLDSNPILKKYVIKY